MDAPTVIYVPFTLHYAPEFTIWATTSKQIEWDKDNQLLYWYPAKELTLNQIIIGKSRNLDTSILPKQAKDLASEVTMVDSLSANISIYFDYTVAKTTNTLKILCRSVGSIPKKEEEEKIYTNNPFLALALFFLLIPYVFYSRTHWERYSLEFQTYLYY